ncbi:hypothetical protein [Thioalkalivibrio sp.]
MYRAGKTFARKGIELCRQTLSGSIVQLTTALAPAVGP